MSHHAALDPARIEIIRHALISIANQVEANLTRTAYSPLIYEYKDYCVGLVDFDGRIIAQSHGSIPIFLADLASSIRDSRRIYSDEGLNAGDVIITNYAGTMGQHLNNVDMFTPVFIDGEPIAFSVIRAHWADVGGRYVGSASSNDTTEIFQEGIQLRTLKLLRNGKRVPEIYRIIEHNTRFPEMVLGDVEAQVAGCLMGRDLLIGVFRRHGPAAMATAIQEIWHQAEAQSRATVSRLADGRYSAEAFLDDDGVDVGNPVRVHVTASIKNDVLTVDFSGTSPEVRGPFNSGRSGGAETAAKVAFKYLTSPAQPVNDGSFRNLRVTIPDHTFLSAAATAAMARYSTPLPTVIDTVIKALAPVLPEGVAAGHHASMGSHQFVGQDTRTGKRFKHLDTALGGWGATAHADGAGPFKTLAHGDTHDIPIEVQEALYGLHVESYELRRDSGGAGRHRGGLGTVKRYTVESPCHFTATFERYGCPPWGLEGGQPGRPGFVMLKRTDDAEQRIHKVTEIPLAPGDTLTIVTSGGGGWGNPWQRSVDAVQADVRNGYVSTREAREQYAVAIDENGRVDENETEAMRTSIHRTEFP